jgi:site-specific DNA recombinase
MPHVFKQLNFLGVRLITLAEGYIDELHIGFKGTMNAVFLKDLRGKVRRGLRGRVEKGKSGGGLGYGYEVVRHLEFDARGRLIRGDRTINQQEAEVVIRVFRWYADGVSPRAIAQRLIGEGIPSSSGGKWTDSTIRGHVRRGTGLINNQLYIGKLVWDRVSYVKNPATDKRVARENPREQWLASDVPELRIVDDELWGEVKAKQAELQVKYANVIAAVRAYHLNATHRHRYFLSGLLTCDVCGGPYSIRGADRYACSNRVLNNSCSNNHTIIREEIEARVLDGLRGPLMDPKVAGAALRAYVEETKRLNREWLSTHDADRKMLAEIPTKLKRLRSAIEDGGDSRTLVAGIRELEAQENEIRGRLSRAPAEVHVNPNLAGIFRRKVEHLAEALQCPDEFDEACATIRGLIDHVTLTPGSKRGDIAATLYGDLATIVAWTTQTDIAGAAAPAMSVSVVAGVRNHHTKIPGFAQLKIACGLPLPSKPR